MSGELEEGLKRRQLGDTQRAVIVVKNHKTGWWRASAELGKHHSFSLQGEKSRHYWWPVSRCYSWMKLLQTMSLDSPLAFPDFDGQEVSHLERKIEVATRPLGHSLPTTTMFRKELEIRNKRQEGPTREAVSRALSHSLYCVAVLPGSHTR